MMRRTLARARYVVGSHKHARRAARSLRSAAERATEPEQLRDAMASLPGPVHLRAVQVPSEIDALLALLRAEPPRRVLEIGTAEGGTLYLLAWASDPAARILSLDIREYEPGRVGLYRSFGRRTQRIEVMRTDSRSDATRAEVERFFAHEPLDLLFIDGDHSYDAVRDDYERYSPLVRIGGLVAFHDIVEGPESAVGGVPRFWREVRGELNDSQELVESRDQGGYGIGLGRRRG
jgi:predicted O-methyltransferase YrrM